MRDSVAQIIGTSPRARKITGATVAVLAIAIVAFLALDPAEDAATGDAYILAADDACVQAKKEIVAAGRQAVGQGPGTAASDLIPIVVAWRADLGALETPGDDAAQARALDTALRDVEIDAGALARVARDGSQKQLAEAAATLNTQTGVVEEAISELGLTRCARVAVAPGAQGGGG